VHLLPSLKGGRGLKVSSSKQKERRLNGGQSVASSSPLFFVEMTGGDDLLSQETERGNQSYCNYCRIYGVHQMKEVSFSARRSFVHETTTCKKAGVKYVRSCAATL